MLGPCRFRNDQHLRIHPPLERWVKEQAKSDEVDRLFVYLHLREETFVIGWWVNKSAGLFVDLFNIGKSLEEFDSIAAEHVKAVLRATTGQDALGETLTKAEYSNLRGLQDEGDHTSALMEHDRSTKVSVAVP